MYYFQKSKIEKIFFLQVHSYYQHQILTSPLPPAAATCPLFAPERAEQAHPPPPGAPPMPPTLLNPEPPFPPSPQPYPLLIPAAPLPLPVEAPQ